MKILIIEDTDYKIQDLQQFLSSLEIRADVQVARSFQGGKRSLEMFKPNLVLLDMTIQTSEREDGQLEGRNRIYGGREILAEMDFLDLNAKAIVVTQFEHFGEPPNSMDLSELFKELRGRFPKYFFDGVYYSSINSVWKAKLKAIFKRLLEEYEDFDR